MDPEHLEMKHLGQDQETVGRKLLLLLESLFSSRANFVDPSPKCNEIFPHLPERFDGLLFHRSKSLYLLVFLAFLDAVVRLRASCQSPQNRQRFSFAILPV